MKYVIWFFFGILAIALAISVVALMIDTYAYFYIFLGEWVFFAAFLALSVLLLIVKIVLKKKILKVNLETNEKYKVAQAKDVQLKAEFDKQVESVLKQKQDDLRRETIQLHQFIEERERKIQQHQASFDANPILHKDDKTLIKMMRLIDLMEHGRADSVKEALRLDDVNLKEREERRARQMVEQAEREKAEQFRREQQERLERIEAEQKRYHDRMIEEQEKQNEELRKLNGYK